MAKNKDKGKKETTEGKDVEVKEGEVKEDIKDIKEDNNKKDDNSKSNEKVYILWYKRNEKDDWNKVNREFKTETSGNNHNIFVLGYEITTVLIKGKQPE